MLEFNASALESVLDLDLDDPRLDQILLADFIKIYNDPAEPTEIIYLILSPCQNKVRYLNRAIQLTGSPANLVILTPNDLEINALNLRNFKAVAICDNKYHRDGNSFIVIDEENYYDAKVTLRNSSAVNLYFC
jgi:hypothetical protein